MVELLFSVLGRKYTFGANLVQNFKIVSLSWDLVTGLIRICRTQRWCSLFCFSPEILFLGKFDPKTQNCQFKLTFGTYNNSKMKNSMMTFISSVLYLFFASFVRKIHLAFWCYLINLPAVSLSETWSQWLFLIKSY